MMDNPRNVINRVASDKLESGWGSGIRTTPNAYDDPRIAHMEADRRREAVSKLRKTNEKHDEQRSAASKKSLIHCWTCIGKIRKTLHSESHPKTDAI